MVALLATRHCRTSSSPENLGWSKPSRSRRRLAPTVMVFRGNTQTDVVTRTRANRYLPQMKRTRHLRTNSCRSQRHTSCCAGKNCAVSWDMQVVKMSTHQPAQDGTVMRVSRNSLNTREDVRVTMDEATSTSEAVNGTSCCRYFSRQLLVNIEAHHH